MLHELFTASCDALHVQEFVELHSRCIPLNLEKRDCCARTTVTHPLFGIIQVFPSEGVYAVLETALNDVVVHAKTAVESMR